mgnify:FL=1
MRFSKMLKWIEEVWDLLNIFVPNSNFFKRKSPCKSAFQNKLFEDVFDPEELLVPCVVVPNKPCQTTEKERESLIKLIKNSLFHP